MIERLEATLNRYNELTDMLSSPEILGNVDKMTSLSKEQASIAEVVDKYKEYKKADSDLEEAKGLLNDPEMADLAKEDVNNLTVKKEELIKELEILLLPKDPNDDKNIIVEIRGAAGGDEANIFAGDLFEMYSRYAESQGWRIEVTNAEPGAAGGYAQIEFMVKGENVYSKLKYESGSHRVHRVPETESQGRVHTSTATVLVMPEVEDVNIDVKESDLRIDVYRSTGAGGQGVNTTDSAVRITHIPTGIVVTCQNERSQLKNKELALKVLKGKLISLEEEKKKEEKEKQLGTQSDINFGSQIRSYIMCPYTLVKDHRTNYEKVDVNKVLDGDIDDFIEEYLKGGANE